MLTAWMFFFGCLLCLMFLGMLYGEQLSLLGLFDGRWLGPVARVMSDAWSELLRGIDDALEFAFENAPWVLATTSGTAGLMVVAFMLFSGLASDANAVHRDAATPMQQGGVLDSVPEISAQVVPSRLRLASLTRDDSHLVRQEPGGIWSMFSPPPVRTINDLPPFPRQPVQDWNTSFAELHLSLDRSVLRSPGTDDVLVPLAHSMVIESPPISLQRLRDDNWRARETFLGWASRNRPGGHGLQEALPESTLVEVEDQQSRVKILPGASVQAQDLRIEKVWPQSTSGNEVTLELTVVNIGDDVVHGLLIREVLPLGCDVTQVSPDGTIRNCVVTWVIDELQPFDERVCRLTARSSSETELQPESLFESWTEVSAVAAVTSPVVVEREQRDLRPANFDQPQESVLPQPAEIARPEVRLQIDEPPASVAVGQTVEVYFNVTNIGTAAADNVQLRVTLDQGLDHHTLTDKDFDRRVENAVRRIAPGDTRSIVLRIRATEPGEHRATAEMMFQGERLVHSIFRVVATDTETPVREFDALGPRP